MPMRTKAIATLLVYGVCASSTLRAESTTQWSLTGSGSTYKLDGYGDPTGDDGAEVSLSSVGGDESKFGGAATTLDATPFRGRTLILSADVSTQNANAGAALWLRADGPQGKLAFINSERQPVIGTSPPTRREIALDVPQKATRIVLGALLKGNGETTATHLRLVPDAEVALITGVSPADVLDKAIQIVRINALHSRDVDWSTVEPEIRAMAKDAKTYPDVYPAIRTLLAKLGDHHSSFMRPAASHAMSSQGHAMSAPIISVQAEGVGYVMMPGYFGTDQNAAQTFIGTITQAIAKTSSNVHCGWIVDLRDNPGGNMWPMLGALRPLLGSGDLGGFEGPTGHSPPWRAPPYSGASTIKLPDLSGASVAVLTGAKTASSGEIVTIAFRGRAKTRSFGTATAGLSTSNRTFDLPDGSRIQLTYAIDVDRDGHAYGGPLQPDQPVLADSSDKPDATIAAATAWLKQSSGCTRIASPSTDSDAPRE